MVPVTHPSSLNTSDDGEDEENKPYKCNVCCKGFKLKGGLQQHERTHSTDRPYICPDCGKLFRQPTHLQQHLRIHTGEKPYDCTFCDKSFRQRTILNQHLRIHTGEKPYICMECGKQFRQKAILDQHYRTHLGDKPYACPHPSCRKHFREMASLISHMKCHKDVAPDPKAMLQQAKRLIKEEKLEEFANNAASEVLSVPHPPNNHQEDHGRDHNDHPQNPRYQNGEQSSHVTSRPFSSPNQRSPMQTNTTPAQPAIPEPSQQQQNLSSSSAQMSMANLIPYPHSIFPATSYMMSSSDPRQYHQLPPNPSSASNHQTGSTNSLTSRNNQ